MNPYPNGALQSLRPLTLLCVRSLARSLKVLAKSKRKVFVLEKQALSNASSLMTVVRFFLIYTSFCLKDKARLRGYDAPTHFAMRSYDFTLGDAASVLAGYFDGRLKHLGSDVRLLESRPWPVPAGFTPAKRSVILSPAYSPPPPITTSASSTPEPAPPKKKKRKYTRRDQSFASTPQPPAEPRGPRSRGSKLKKKRSSAQQAELDGLLAKVHKMTFALTPDSAAEFDTIELLGRLLSAAVTIARLGEEARAEKLIGTFSRTHHPR